MRVTNTLPSYHPVFLPGSGWADRTKPEMFKMILVHPCMRGGREGEREWVVKSKQYSWVSDLLWSMDIWLFHREHDETWEQTNKHTHTHTHTHTNTGRDWKNFWWPGYTSKITRPFRYPNFLTCPFVSTDPLRDPQFHSYSVSFDTWGRGGKNSLYIIVALGSSVVGKIILKQVGCLIRVVNTWNHPVLRVWFTPLYCIHSCT